MISSWSSIKLHAGPANHILAMQGTPLAPHLNRQHAKSLHLIPHTIQTRGMQCVASGVKYSTNHYVFHAHGKALQATTCQAVLRQTSGAFLEPPIAVMQGRRVWSATCSAFIDAVQCAYCTLCRHVSLAANFWACCNVHRWIQGFSQVLRNLMACAVLIRTVQPTQCVHSPHVSCISHRQRAQPE